jgi:hypothetical protein
MNIINYFLITIRFKIKVVGVVEAFNLLLF